MPVTETTIEANGMTFRARMAGGGGEPVILLHGFPETSHMYIPLMERLEGEGYRCLAPDQRGYSPGARPEGVENYRYHRLAEDIGAFADWMGADRFHLVGHDWGALAGWAYVCSMPERVLSWTALSVPHAQAFGTAIRNDPDQAQRSQYVQLFVQEGAAEAAFMANDWAVLKGVWSASDDAEKAEYFSVMSQPGALTAGFNWYRASNGIDPANEEIVFGEVTTPTLLIWGNQDRAIGRTGVVDGEQYMKGSYRLLELDAGHWLVQEKPEEVVDAVLAHLKANPA
ncbi:MAG: alpha/beta hydrolase [Dehalococcoidia bacterium]